MPVIRINAVNGQAQLHCSPKSTTRVLRQLRNIPGPVIIMTHGFKYQPYNRKTCPHRHILSLQPRMQGDSCPSWPQQLGFGAGFENEGLALAFGWDASGPLWKTRSRALAAGRVLAKVINELHHCHHDRPIHFIGHSMGVELALEALHHIQPGAIRRIISMTGAAYRSRTLRALLTPAGHQAELINITSRENDLFDFLYERIIQPPTLGDRSIGSGIQAKNAVTLQIDCPATLDHLSNLALPVAAPQRRICHWSSYTRPGLLRLYNALLRNPERISLGNLRAGLPSYHQRRWSRLFALPRPQKLLPCAQKA
ncbi:alpha/beta hydrolase [Ruegeria arenilitoris]|uniref:alpha/beta hydrolase n=1 Tax=Ruegeria arenilitoris TaxID=1173585 RepID=UPI00147B3930|nr:alpha/beta hydrolase [Ruegeria arenilitoris]